MRVFPHTRCYIHVRRCENTRRGTCLHRFSLLSYLSSQSLKNFSWGACSRSGFSLHKSTNCLSKESWKLSNFEAIFTSKSVTPSLRLLSWVKKLSHDPLRQACNFVYVDAMLPFGKIFAIRYCQTKSFWRGRKEIRHIPQHFISSFIVCRVVEQQGSLIRWAPCGLHIKRQKTTESIQFMCQLVPLMSRWVNRVSLSLWARGFQWALLLLVKEPITNLILVIKSWPSFFLFFFFREEACSAFVTCTVSWLRAQEHPTTVFYEISVRRSKNCLEFSIA